MRIPFFSKRFNDEALDQCVTISLESDGLVDASRIIVSSKEGVIKLNGRARNLFEKKRVGNLALQGLDAAGLRYARLEDHVVVESQLMV
ncbi:MAG: hypothetical protein R3E79_57000 [Caldilineaceae bacterium]